MFLNNDCIYSILQILGKDYIYILSEVNKQFNFVTKHFKDKCPPSLRLITSKTRMFIWAERHPDFKYSSELLGSAIRDDQYFIINYLISKQCDIKEDNLFCAIRKGNEFMLKNLMEYWESLGRKFTKRLVFSMFIIGCNYGKLHILIKLYKKYKRFLRSEAYESTCVDVSISNRHDRVLSWLIRKEFRFDYSSLEDCIVHNNFYALKKLVCEATHRLHIHVWPDNNLIHFAENLGREHIATWLRTIIH